ncbi:hypothetical protein GQ457_16G007600 [Hibiscus cannabinus]
MGQRQQNDGHYSVSGGFDMQLIGNFLSFASRGDRVGLNQMLRDGISPDVQDYDRRTALHLAASEGHAPIVELLLLYKANVNPIDRWNRTPLTDARLYGHRDICRILEVNGGKDIDDKEFINEQPTMNDQTPVTVRHEPNSNEVIDISELGAESSVIKPQDNTLLHELRHPNILQFLGSIVQGEEMILITEYLPKDNLDLILEKKGRLDFSTALRYALDIARGMNYLHEHKPKPIVHNNLDPRNLLQDESGHLKIGEYWVQMLYEQIQPNQESCMYFHPLNFHVQFHDENYDTKKDVLAFGFILYQMLEGRHVLNGINVNCVNFNSFDLEIKFPISRCPRRIQELIENCTSNDPSRRPAFNAVIETLEEASDGMGRVCIGQYCA